MRLPAACFSAILMLFCAFFAGSASAQTGGIYSVADVQVDETAQSAAQARPAAFLKAQQLAWARLVERLAPPADFARLGAPAVAPAVLDRMAVSVDVQDERRSATRYIARLTVNFNPSLVRQVLAEAGYGAVFEERAAPVLLVPSLAGASPTLDQPWRRAWTQQGFARELRPLIATFEPIGPRASWSAAETEAAAVGAASALFVSTQAVGSQLVADLTEVGPSGAVIERGRVSVQVAPGEQGYADAFSQLAAAVNRQLQTEWKQLLAAGRAAPAERLAVQALYEDFPQWLRLKNVLESAARTLVSDIRIEAVSARGAMVSLGYVGGFEQLRAELARFGGVLEPAGEGAVLRLAAGAQ